MHSQLVANTKDQVVYEVVMAGAWDHQLCLTYPDKVSKLSAMNTELATIADGWDNYMVVTLAKFLKGTNCYGATIKNLDKCPDCGETSGSGCATEEDKDKKCPGFLTIVATQECDGKGGLPPSAKNQIEGFITDLFEDWKDSDDYDQYLEKVKDDDRGIFDFPVSDDVVEKRSEDDIMTKLEALRESKAPTLKAELLDLTDAQFIPVFGDGAVWRDLILTIPEAATKLYTIMGGLSGRGFLQCVNHMTDEQFIAYVDASPANLTKALSEGYAAMRYYGHIMRSSDGDALKRLQAMTAEQVYDFYESGPDAEARLYLSLIHI